MAGRTKLSLSDDNARLHHLLNKCVRSDSGCLEFQGCIQANGYARATVRRKTDYAHRHSYRLHSGTEIPQGLDVCHTCDNRKCINPSHLFLGTRKENMEDAVSKDRQAKGFDLPITKLSQDDINEIVRLAKSGLAYKEIAKLFGITRPHAGYVALKNGVRRNGISK